MQNFHCCEKPFRVRQRLSDLSLDGAVVDRHQRETPIVKTEEAPEEDLVKYYSQKYKNPKRLF
jgi:hypothetical protein